MQFQVPEGELLRTSLQVFPSAVDCEVGGSAVGVSLHETSLPHSARAPLPFPSPPGFPLRLESFRSLDGLGRGSRGSVGVWVKRSKQGWLR